MYTLRMAAYCGMGYPVTEPDEDRAEARAAAARILRRRRRQGFPVVMLNRGLEWEIQEPLACVMVPDQCGTLYIHHDTFPCSECGNVCETRDAARDCCAETIEEYVDDAP